MSGSCTSVTARVVEVVAIVAGAGTLAAAGWWAFGSTTDRSAVSESRHHNSEGAGGNAHPLAGPLAPVEQHAQIADPDAFDLAAFDAPIWVEPPAPPAPPPAPAVVEIKPVPPAPTPPPPPLKLQLIAISTRAPTAREGTAAPTVYRAIVYDPDSDSLLTLETGQSLAAGRSVEHVNASTVSFRDGPHVRTLALREPDPILDDLSERQRGRSHRKEPAR